MTFVHKPLKPADYSSINGVMPELWVTFSTEVLWYQNPVPIVVYNYFNKRSMSAYDFIFSNERKHRLTRHLVFWVAYCSYFYIQSIPPHQFSEFFIGRTYFIALMNLCCFAPVFIAAVYIFIYYLLPRTIQRKKYLLFVFSSLLVYAVGSIINYFMASVFLYCTHYFPMTFQHKIEMGNFNTRWGMVIAIIALGIKLSKNFYLQQKENLELLKKKTRSQMQLEKARIHPELLLRSLHTIYTTPQSDKAPSLILHLSDLLSFSLYESECERVLLERELIELTHLLTLEENNIDNTAGISVCIEGEVSNQLIAPMTLVKLVEESISLLYQNTSPPVMMNLHIAINGQMLSLKSSIFYDAITKNENHHPYSLLHHTEQRMKMHYRDEDFKLVWKELPNESLITLDLRLADKTTPIVKAPNNSIVYESA